MPYEVKLQGFEGPLDLLLHLISKAKVDIKDIFVSEITEQYLEYIRAMEEMDMEVTSEFLTMAATLLYIKSKSLLPAIQPEEDGEEEDEEALLIARLQEYQRIKKVSDTLSVMAEGAAKNYYKLPEDYIFDDGPLNLNGIGVEDLFTMLSEMIAEREQAQEPAQPMKVVRTEKFTVREKISKIRRTLALKKRTSFAELFEEDATKLEIIVTFLALLELISSEQAVIEQDQTYGEILIFAREPALQ